MVSDEGRAVIDSGGIQTPAKFVFVGALLTFLESIFDLPFAEMYTGELDGVVVTETDVIIFTLDWSGVRSWNPLAQLHKQTKSNKERT